MKWKEISGEEVVVTTECPGQKSEAPTAEAGSSLSGREVAQMAGLIMSLAAMTLSTPELIIRKMTGILWSAGEADDLLKATKPFDDMNDRLVREIINADSSQTKVPASSARPFADGVRQGMKMAIEAANSASVRQDASNTPAGVQASIVTAIERRLNEQPATR